MGNQRPQAEVDVLRMLCLQRERGDPSQFWTLSNELAEGLGDSMQIIDRVCAALEDEGCLESHVRARGARAYRITQGGLVVLYEHEKSS